MTKIGELRELGTEDLDRRMGELDDQVFRLRIQQSMGKTDTPHKMRERRRDRARVKTLLRERELESGQDG